jgi:hypothetical protein
MRRNDLHLPVSELTSRLQYDPETGIVVWLVPPHPRFKVGHAVGFTRKAGYRAVELDGKTYALHNLIWAMQTGSAVPDGSVIDHANGDPGDNRWTNLRLATPTQNNANTALRKGKTLPKGVSEHRKKGIVVAYRAFASANGKINYLGLYQTPEAAHAAYLQAAEKLFGDFAKAG